MANNTSNNQGCLIGLFILFLVLGFGFWGFWIVAYLIYLAINNKSQPSSPSSNTSRASPSANTSRASTKTSEPPPTISPSVPDDLDNILRDIANGEIKDPVTQDIFHPGEKVYLCGIHRLAYHEDSWREMGCKCMVCGNNTHIKMYSLPIPMNIQQQDVSKLIEFRDIE